MKSDAYFAVQAPYWRRTSIMLALVSVHKRLVWAIWQKKCRHLKISHLTVCAAAITAEIPILVLCEDVPHFLELLVDDVQLGLNSLYVLVIVTAKDFRIKAEIRIQEAVILQ